MNQSIITVSKYDAYEYSLILRNAGIDYHTESDGENCVFYIDEDDAKTKWLNKLAEDMHIGHIKVSAPSVQNYNSFMDALDSYDLEIIGTKYTWLFGYQYFVKGHERNLSAFCRHLKSQKRK